MDGPEQIRQWWGPDGFTCPRADVDFRVGGSTLVAMAAPPEYGGFLMHNLWTYTAIAEPTRLEFVSRFADADGNPIDPAAAGIPPGVPAEVPHVVDLEPLAGGRTRVTVTEFGYTRGGPGTVPAGAGAVSGQDAAPVLAGSDGCILTTSALRSRPTTTTRTTPGGAATSSTRRPPSWPSSRGPSGRALELAIGTGRVALPLRRRGVDVSGIDLSAAMVDQLRAKPGGDAVPVVIGDIASTRVEG